MSDYLKDYTDMVLKATLGEHIRIGHGWLVVQPAGEDRHAVVGCLSGPLLLPGAEKHTHQLIHGSVIIRPYLVAAGDRYRGCGLAGIATSDAFDPANWDKVLLNLLPTDKSTRVG